MPRYLLRIRDDHDTLVDPELIDLPDLEEARAAALDTIEDLWVRQPWRVRKDMQFQVAENRPGRADHPVRALSDHLWLSG